MQAHHALTRHTLRLLAQPGYFIEDGWGDLNIHAWREGFTWRRDPLKGALDHVSPIETTVETQRGDCDDFAVVAASWLHAQDRPVYLGISTQRFIPRHVFVVDGDGRVYEGTGRLDPNGYVHDSLMGYLASVAYTDSHVWRVA